MTLEAHRSVFLDSILIGVERLARHQLQYGVRAKLFFRKDGPNSAGLKARPKSGRSSIGLGYCHRYQAKKR